ncbi:MAG: hypothetical protein KAJ36_09605, partial [Candidatus Thorarchaeota archaeon]|nr:hypothetical protein [Candidatus Thorarchaeota archaeon]
MNKRQNMASIISIIAILLIIQVVPIQGYSVAQTDVVRNYWPTEQWLNTTPAEQGLSFDQLDQINSSIIENDIELDSV